LFAILVSRPITARELTGEPASKVNRVWDATFHSGVRHAHFVPMRTRIKICCIASVEEACFVIAAGAESLGLVAAMQSGHGAISDVSIAEVTASAYRHRSPPSFLRLKSQRLVF
jgi:hypothetical protein